MSVQNNYVAAVAIDDGLYVVTFATGGWGIADGPGFVLSEPGEEDLAGWHLPVKFESFDQAVQAIRTRPTGWFDIEPDSVWTKHCLACGAEFMGEE